MIAYCGRKGYKNLRIGCFRIVYSKEEKVGVRNLTMYLYLGKDHTLDVVFTLKWPRISYNKF